MHSRARSAGFDHSRPCSSSARCRGSVPSFGPRNAPAGLVAWQAIAHCEKTFPLCFGGSRLDGSTATLDGQGEKVCDHFFGQSSFATYALANERHVVKVSRDVPLGRLGPLAW